ncbi:MULTISPECIES: hypothetical protein [Bradyrhizobium]|nr:MULTISPECIES: hypothetical protein [Bradyrhizobium]
MPENEIDDKGSDALLEKLAALIAERKKYVAEHRKSAPKASSFDPVVGIR